MSANLKSGNAIVRLLLAHGEKIGIAAILICTALIIWSAMGRERLEREPSELNNLSNQTKTQVASFTWDALPEDAKLITEPLPPAEAARPTKEAFPNYVATINEPIRAQVKQRTDPVLLAPLDLEVASDSGLWTAANPDLIRERALEAEREQERRRAEERREEERAGRDPNSRGRGEFGARDGGYGAATGRGGPDDRTPRDAPIIAQPMGGARVQGFEQITAKSWVTVLAKVPIEQQVEMYNDALKNARGYSPTADMPNYLGYQIERAEITPTGQSDWKAIAIVNDKKIIKEMSTYPINVPDVIDPDVNHPILTHPLPPLILREWGDRVSHSSMPLALEKAREEAEERNQPAEEEEEAAPVDPDNPFADPELAASERGAMRGEFGRGGEMGYGRGGEMGYGRGGEYGGEFGRGGEMGYGRGGEYGGEFGRGGEMGFGRGGEFGGGYGGGYGSLGRGSATTLAEYNWDHETPHILLRYFDNTVKPGHSYRYRIRLSIRDVNDKVREKFLDKTVTQRREAEGNKNYRWTDWSEPSPVVGVAPPARIFVMKAEPARESSYTSEDEVEVLIKAYESQYAAEVARAETFSVGSVLNLSDKAKVMWVNRFDEEETPTFDFMTDVTVLDIEGGQDMEVSRDLVTPARALMMNAAGQLFLQSELEDEETVQEYNDIIEEANDPRDRGRGGGRGGRGGEYGGEFGGRGEFGGEYGGEYGR